jgi:hypothetical protein
MKCQYCDNNAIAKVILETKQVLVCNSCLRLIELETNKTVVFNIGDENEHLSEIGRSS